MILDRIFLQIRYYFEKFANSTLIQISLNVKSTTFIFGQKQFINLKMNKIFPKGNFIFSKSFYSFNSKFSIFSEKINDHFLFLCTSTKFSTLTEYGLSLFIMVSFPIFNSYVWQW